MKIHEMILTDYSVADDFLDAGYNEMQLQEITKINDFVANNKKVNYGYIMSSHVIYMEKMGYLILYMEFDDFAEGVQVHITWRDSTDAYEGNKDTRGIIGTLYRHLTDKFGTVYSDDIQTVEGKALWLRLIAEAKSKGYRVGFYDMMEKMHHDLSDTHHELMDFWNDEKICLFIKKP